MQFLGEQGPHPGGSRSVPFSLTAGVFGEAVMERDLPARISAGQLPEHPNETSFVKKRRVGNLHRLG